MKKILNLKRHIINNWPLANKSRIAKILIPFEGKDYNNTNEISFLKPSLLLHTSNDSYLEYLVYCTGDYEPEINHIFKSLIRAGDTVLDIGANIGIHTLRMSLYVGNTGSVYSFEPINDIVERLEANLKLNFITNVRVLPYALSDSDSFIKLRYNMNNRNKGITSLNMVEEPNRDVTVKNGDKLLLELQVKKVEFIKIDVEGFEWNVIQGLSHTITRDRPKIIYEFGKNVIERYPERDIREEMLDFFIGLKFNLYTINSLGVKLIKKVSDFPDFGNILCLPVTES